MIDREQVIRGLELCVSHDSDKCYKCPYHPQCQEYYYTALKEDALTLLKEQEPKRTFKNGIGTTRCGVCGSVLSHTIHSIPDDD